MGSYRKVTIEDEEEEWFSPGEVIPVFTHGALTFGVAICADIGNPSVFAACARQGAPIVFEVAGGDAYFELAHAQPIAAFLRAISWPMAKAQPLRLSSVSLAMPGVWSGSMPPV